tara:strand:- start:951 stop:1442 length:492 start_codon:yes stop_codon:yes gene_type:complete
MKKFFLIFTITFANFSWSSNQSEYLDSHIYFPKNSLDGKNLICNWNGIEKEDFPDNIDGYKFKVNKVERYHLILNKTVAEIRMWRIMDIKSITTDEVVWGEYWSLNREDLILKYNQGWASDWRYQCRVLPNLQAYKEEMNGYKIKLQKLIDDKISKGVKKNKI